MTDEQLLSALQAEYLQLQKTIEDFDARALTVKAWSVTFSLVAVGGAFASHAALIFLVSSLSALLFWLIEGTWKKFQYAYYKRSGLIEAHFRGEARVAYPFQIAASWSTAWHAGGSSQLFRLMAWPQVALPHVFVALLGLVFYALTIMGRINV